MNMLSNPSDLMALLPLPRFQDHCTCFLIVSKFGLEIIIIIRGLSVAYSISDFGLPSMDRYMIC